MKCGGGFEKMFEPTSVIIAHLGDKYELLSF